MKLLILIVTTFSWMNLLNFSTLESWCYASETSKEEFVYNANGRRDPMVPLVTGEKGVVSGLYGVESIDDIQIEGIVVDPQGGSIAVLNGIVLREGEGRDHVMLKKIETGGVTVAIHEMEFFRPYDPSHNNDF